MRGFLLVAVLLLGACGSPAADRPSMGTRVDYQLGGGY